MVEDGGLWFVEGRVVNKAHRDRVWADYDKRWQKAYRAKCRLEARHRRELARAEALVRAVVKTQPFTPWVGRADEGAVERFLMDARRNWEWRKHEKFKA